MSTAVSSRLVRDYLDHLRLASRQLPSSSASQLRAQIAAHLAERLRPDADPEEIEEALAELGSPDQLVAEQLALTGRSKLAGVRRIRWWGWLGILVALAGVGTLIGLIVSVRTTPDLEGPGSFGWLTAWDVTHSRSTDNLNGSQVVTAIHPGHRQGFIVSVTNNTHRAQTILGPPADSHSFGSFRTESIGVSGYSKEIDGGGMPPGVRYAPSARIPPGQTRLVEVSWVSQRGCFLAPGSSEGSDTLDLRVRIGPFTRTEHIALEMSIGLYGTKAGCSDRSR